MWSYSGQRRPDFALAPAPGEESVWDYPRPPVLVEERRRVTINWGNIRVLSTDRCFRVLETASPPTFYFSPGDVPPGLLVAARGQSHCEWKGVARYWTLRNQHADLPRVAWSYPSPSPAFAAIADWLASYPQDLECLIDDERVRPQGGPFYGGWVTYEIIGPWKGQAGTGGW